MKESSGERSGCMVALEPLERDQGHMVALEPLERDQVVWWLWNHWREIKLKGNYGTTGKRVRAKGCLWSH